MSEIVAFRMDEELMKKIDKISGNEDLDRSTVIRKLILLGYEELAKEDAEELYKKGKITLSEAASRANLTLWEMEKFLVDRGYKSEYSIADLEKEMMILEK